MLNKERKKASLKYLRLIQNNSHGINYAKKKKEERRKSSRGGNCQWHLGNAEAAQ